MKVEMDGFVVEKKYLSETTRGLRDIPESHVMPVKCSVMYCSTIDLLYP